MGGGAVHACVCAMAPGGLGWRRLPALALKDACGFAAFFGVFSYIQRRLQPVERDLNERWSVSQPRQALGSIGSSIVAGAVAGGAYHFIAFPWERAVALAPADGTDSVLSVARRQGLIALYAGVTRTAAKGIGVGALTFAVYDVLIRELVQPDGTRGSVN